MGSAQSKPANEVLTTLQGTTHFDRKEIVQWYNGFMKQAPTGSISLPHFINLYQRFFPFGDPAPFAGLVFRAFDTNESGAIEFEEYVTVLSVTSRGRLEEKIQWAFSFYDLDGDGRISREELMVVVSAIYRMILSGALLTPSPRDSHSTPAIAATPEERVEQILGEMDSDGDGFITLEEFRAGAHTEPSILQGLLLYDGLV